MNNIHSVWKKVDIKGPDECWPWTGKWISDVGYGRLDINNEAGVYAHRAAYISAVPYASIGLRRAGMNDNVCHTCDNPSCCNPAHLFLGTHLENMQDKKNKGRCPNFKGIKGPNAKLTQEDIDEIKIYKAGGATIRAIALLFGVSRSCISHLLYGLSYKDYV